jgi:hypothetical protein
MPPVKPKPLYRSITFWSGLLVMAFIVWAWADSQKVISVGTIGSPMAIHGHSGIMIRKTHATGTGAWRLPIRNFYEDHVISDLFPPPFSFATAVDALERKSEIHNTLPDHRRDGALPIRIVAEYWAPEGIQRNRTFFIPHWLLLLAVALPWSGLLIWRARRIRRGSPPIP